VTDLRYPIGKFAPPETYTPGELDGFFNRIKRLPAQLEKALSTLTEEQIDTPYREDGWTVRQVVHHLADSHMNAYIRFKWALTEETPTIKAYDEKKWAETPETQALTQLSVALLKALHDKWVTLMRGMSAADWDKQFVHNQTHKTVRLAQVAGTYAWHGEHHLAHITALKARMDWK
jgi:hypothetical protein